MHKKQLLELSSLLVVISMLFGVAPALAQETGNPCTWNHHIIRFANDEGVHKAGDSETWGWSGMEASQFILAIQPGYWNGEQVCLIQVSGYGELGRFFFRSSELPAIEPAPEPAVPATMCVYSGEYINIPGATWTIGPFTAENVVLAEPVDGVCYIREFSWGAPDMEYYFIPGNSPDVSLPVAGGTGWIEGLVEVGSGGVGLAEDFTGEVAVPSAKEVKTELCKVPWLAFLCGNEAPSGGGLSAGVNKVKNTLYVGVGVFVVVLVVLASLSHRGAAYVSTDPKDNPLRVFAGLSFVIALVAVMVLLGGFKVKMAGIAGLIIFFIIAGTGIFALLTSLTNKGVRVPIPDVGVHRAQAGTTIKLIFAVFLIVIVVALVAPAL